MCVAMVVGWVGHSVYCDFGATMGICCRIGGAMRANCSRQCTVAYVQWSALQLVMSAIVLVAVLKMGGELVHPMGNMSGNAMVAPSLSIGRRTIPSFGMSGTWRPIR